MTQQREINAKNGAVSKMRSSRIISFDIFDTLLGRIVASPMDVFRLMVDDIGGVVGYSVPDFVNIRRHAEKAANTIARQEHDKEDVTLAEIYAQLGTMLSLSDEQIAQAMDVEMKWERACLVPRAAGQYLWQRARKLHKDIILVSDMYLPKEFLESVLRDNGYDGWTKFYLSADYGQTKRSGLLFKHPLADFKAEPENIVHIGDNAVGDISVPKAMGIKTIHIPRTVEILKNVTPFTGKVHTSLIAKGRTLSTSIVSQTIADRMFSGIDDKPTSVFKDDPFEFGYATLGPLVAGFIRWIQTEVQLKGIDRLLFLSRDGEIFHRAYKEMLPNSETKTDYVLSSRRAVNIGTIRNEWDIKTICAKPVYAQTFARLAEHRFGLTKSDFRRSILRENGIDEPGQMIGNKFDKEALESIFIAHKDIIFEKSAQQRSAYKEYLDEFIRPDERVAVVDIGYAGTMQSEMLKLMGRDDIHGFYISCNQETQNKGIPPELVSGYLQDKMRDNLVNSGVNTHRFAYETIICGAQDSFEGFSFDDNGQRVAQFASDTDAEYRKGFVRLAHSGALRFCKDLFDRWPLSFSEFWISGRDAGQLLDEFMRKPSRQDASILRDIEFEDKFATQNKRVLLASPGLKARHKVIEIWNEGVKATAPPKPKPKHKPEDKPTNVEPNRFEAAAVRLMTTQNKFNKYLKNRSKFFADSRYRMLHAYLAATR